MYHHQSTASVPSTVYAKFVFLSGPDKGMTIRMTSPTFTFGRRNMPEVNYVISDAPYVSSKHCSIKFKNNRFVIIDHHSSNGTFLDNKLLEPDTPYDLQTNALIQLGKSREACVVMQFHPEASAHQPYSSPTAVIPNEDFSQNPAIDRVGTSSGERTHIAMEAPQIAIPHGNIEPQATPNPLDFVLSNKFRYIVGGIVGTAAILMIIGFFAFSWLDWDAQIGVKAFEDSLGQPDLVETGMSMLPVGQQEKLETEDFTASALNVWLGNNEDYMLSISKDELVEKGFAQVRWVDRLLILVPLCAAGLVFVIWRFVTERMPRRRALFAMTVLSLIILILPPLWQKLSTENWQNAIEIEDSAGLASTVTGLAKSDVAEALLEVHITQYNYDEQTFLGLVAFITSLVGFLLVEIDYRNLWERFTTKVDDSGKRRLY